MDLRNRIPAGVWAIDLEFGQAEYDRLSDVSAEEFALMTRGYRDMGSNAEGTGPKPDPTKHQVIDGVGIVTIAGTMTRDDYCDGYGSTCTPRARRTLQNAYRDPNVNSIMLYFDESPGGNVSGVNDLALEVRKIAADGKKQIVSYCEDMCASAAYFVASQANKIYCNETAIVGSLGTFTVLYDRSEEFKARGVKTIVVSDGEYKGVGTPGTPITKDQIDVIRERVVAMTQPFKAAVMKGRKFSQEKTDELFSGKSWIGKDAVQLGLVDAIKGFDDVLQQMKGNGMADNNASNSIGNRVLAALGLSDIEANNQSDPPVNAPAPTSPSANLFQRSAANFANNTFLGAVHAAGIVDIVALERMQSLAKLGEQYTEKLHAEVLSASVRFHGEKDGPVVAEGLKHLPADSLAKSIDAMNKAADVKFGIGANAGGASGAGAGAADGAGGATRTSVAAPLGTATAVNAEGSAAGGEGSPERIESLLRMTSLGENAIRRNGNGNGHSGRNN